MEQNVLSVFFMLSLFFRTKKQFSNIISKHALTFPMFFLGKTHFEQKCYSQFHVFTLSFKRMNYFFKKIKNIFFFVKIKPKIEGSNF